jgi:hypothetical protein
MKLEAAYLRDFALRYAAAWCSQIPAAVAAFFTPDGSLRINDGEPAVGRVAIVEAARVFMNALPDMCVTMYKLLIKDETAEFHWTLTGTNTGPGGTGAFVKISGHEEWTFAESGLVQNSLGHFDASDYQRQIAGEYFRG